jgi:hypothetical protein
VAVINIVIVVIVVVRIIPTPRVRIARVVGSVTAAGGAASRVSRLRRRDVVRSYMDGRGGSGAVARRLVAAVSIVRAVRVRVSKIIDARLGHGHRRGAALGVEDRGQKTEDRETY